jgi:hypothetical protein
MVGRRQSRDFLAALLLFCAVSAAARADIPETLPRYDLSIDLDTNEHVAHVRQVTTWTNCSHVQASELVFNAHSHYQVPASDIGYLAKTLELLRMSPTESIDGAGSPQLEVRRIALGEHELPFHYQEPSKQSGPLVIKAMPPGNTCSAPGCGTALVVPLPISVKPGESVTVEIDFTFRLAQKQGRWGQWKGVTFLCTWLPVLAVFDDCGWHPTPFIPWHQPFFNEAAIYTAQVRLPCDQTIGCSAPVADVQQLPGGWKEVVFAPCCLRDWAFLCSARYHEYVESAGPVQIRCVALPEHEHFARMMVHWVCEALPVYNQWFGTYPYPQFTIAESYFGWNGNECAGLVMIDERVFGMPHAAGNFVEYLISHEFCHQWWYNVVGTNGYCETWMDEGLATYFSHRLMDRKKGHNNTLITYPRGLEWLPNIRRENYRSYSLYGTLGRGEEGPTVQEMPKFRHLANLLSMCYDRGGRIVGMIEDRLGEAAFFDFMRLVYARYEFRILRVRDFQHELEAYTGCSWKDFFDNWLYGAGMSDWCVEKVNVRPVKKESPRAAAWAKFEEFIETAPFSATVRAHRTGYKATVLLHQKGEYTEPTVLGISLDNSEDYQIRLPVNPHAEVMEFSEPPAVVRSLPGNRVQVEVVLPCMPTQIAVDPDQVLVDRNPVNNFWKPPIRWHFTPLYSPLEETDVTTDYDKWNIQYGPGFFGNVYNDPWYTRSTVVGLRGSVYRMQEFVGGAYTGFRTDYRDLAVGGDVTLYHWPWHQTQVGFNIERSLTAIDGDDHPSTRGVLYGRYVIDYASSLYLPPMQYVEMFGTIQDHALPEPQEIVPGADHFNHQTAVGLHYHKDYLTPYWDPEGGFKFDMTYASGLPILGEKRSFERLDGQFSIVKGLPDCLGPLSQTRLALRIYGGAALPQNGELFAMGGSSLFRGFDLSDRQGSLLWVASLEWRVPIVRQVTWDCCDHFVGIRNIYAAAFYDVGDCYVNGHSQGPVAHALGGGLRIDVAWLSLIERTTLRFDIAKTVNVDTPVQFWFGLQHPF